MISWRPGTYREDGVREFGHAVALLAIAAARQSACPTALAQARLPVVRQRRCAAFAAPVSDMFARRGTHQDAGAHA